MADIGAGRDAPERNESEQTAIRLSEADDQKLCQRKLQAFFCWFIARYITSVRAPEDCLPCLFFRRRLPKAAPVTTAAAYSRGIKTSTCKQERLHEINVYV